MPNSIFIDTKAIYETQTGITNIDSLDCDGICGIKVPGFSIKYSNNF